MRVRLILYYMSHTIRKPVFKGVLPGTTQTGLLQLVRAMEFRYGNYRYNMSHVMRKPVYGICKQQRHRSTCASLQSDQRRCCLLPGGIIPLLAIAEISRPYLVSSAQQALTVTNPEDRFSRDVAHV